MELTAQEQYERKASLTSFCCFLNGKHLDDFAGFTSAYVVSKSRPDWLKKDFVLPSAFIWSTLSILLGEFNFSYGVKTIKKEKLRKQRYFYCLL